MFCADSGIQFEPAVVDLMTGAHLQEDFLAMNPSGQVPVIDDDGFVLSESSAILKYLADKAGSAAYPKDLRARARVNERMDWFNTGFYRDLAYNLVYPQVFPHHKRRSDEAHAGTLDWGRAKAERWLGILDQRLLGDRKYVCGDAITIADYLGAQMLSCGDLVGVSVKRFSNVDRWMTTMRAMPSWKKASEIFDGFAASLRGQTFVTVA